MMDCDQINARDVIERYLSGELSDTERQDFEDHYFECADCFEILRIARALRMSADPAKSRFWARFTFPSRFRLAFWPIGALIAIVLVGTIYWNRPASKVAPSHGNVDGHADSVVARSPVGTPSSEELSKLPSQMLHAGAPLEKEKAQVQIRKGVSQATMARCSAGDYAGGIKELQAAAKPKLNALELNLDIGECYVFANQPDKAIANLEKAVSPDAPSLAEQAHYYLARAYLQKNDPASARKELEFTIGFHGAMENEARTLEEKLDNTLNASSKE
jgi:tetratricopeptide (TPR) repeat protein